MDRFGTCDDCEFSEVGGLTKDGVVISMFCHRYPPRKGGFAKTYPEDWCGEYKQSKEVE